MSDISNIQTIQDYGKETKWQLYQDASYRSRRRIYVK